MAGTRTLRSTGPSPAWARSSVSGGWDGTVRVWDLEAGAAAHTLTGHEGRVLAVAVSADGRLAVTGGDDGAVRVWDTAGGVELASLASDNRITSLAVTPSGTRVVAGTLEGLVHLLELCAGLFLRQPAMGEHPGPGDDSARGQNQCDDFHFGHEHRLQRSFHQHGSLGRDPGESRGFARCDQVGRPSVDCSTILTRRTELNS